MRAVTQNEANLKPMESTTTPPTIGPIKALYEKHSKLAIFFR